MRTWSKQRRQRQPAGLAKHISNHQREWRRGTGQEGREAGEEGCKTDMQSALLGEVADKKGRLQGGEEGLRVVPHLHSPIKFLYFET